MDKLKASESDKCQHGLPKEQCTGTILHDLPKSVEEKIKELCSFFSASDPRKDYAQVHFKDGLERLCDLVRKEGK